MSRKMVRRLVALSLGKWLPMPLRQWVMDLYSQIDLVDSYKYFRMWLAMLSKMPEVYRRTGVDYEIAKHWAEAVKNTPMDFFDAARTSYKDWKNIFIKIDQKNDRLYKAFWVWSGPNPYQVQIWLAEVVRKFFNALMEEHNQRLEKQRNPTDTTNQESPQDTEQAPEEELGETWQETEKLERQKQQ